MATLKIEERFEVAGSVERVFAFLLDPERVAPCLPGAQLTEVAGERTFHGQMKVKLGPVAVVYKGTIELTAIDREAMRIEMTGKGSEKGGSGSASMTMTSALTRVDEETVAVAVSADVSLAGRIVRFGRGMIQTVAKQLFREFAANVRAALEAEGEAAVGDEAGSGEGERGEAAPDRGESAAGGESATGESEAAPGEGEAAPGAGEAAPDGGESATGESEESAGDGGHAARAGQPGTAGEARTRAAIAPREAEPLRALPLVFRALWAAIRGLFARLLGRGATR